jgi:hypothetical protein
MYRYLLTAPLHTLDRVLKRELGKKSALVERVRNSIVEQRNIKRIGLLRHHQHQRLWSELIAHLKYERTNVKIGREYQSLNASPERNAAFDAYIAVLDKLLDELQGLAQQSQNTPSQTSKKIGRIVPNNGSHWVDWVPAHIKQRISLLFERMPLPPRVKRKIPFQRKIRPEKKNSNSTYSRAVFRLKTRTEKELQLAQSEYFVSKSTVLRERVANIKQALRWIEELRPTDFVPTTWHGFFPDLKEKAAEARKEARKAARKQNGSL